MNESITRSAGARHGQEATPAALADIARSVGRSVRQRTTLYAWAAADRQAAAREAGPLQAVKERPARDWGRRTSRQKEETSA
jgi:FO synthase